MSNFLRTVSLIRRDPFVNPYVAIVKHVFWQLRKALNLFPSDVRLRGRIFRVADRSVANGCGALLNAMGYYDPNNMLLIEEVFAQHEFGVFFDIGANIGVYSIIAAALQSQVFAFEPHPYTYRLLQENIALNHIGDRVHCFASALGDYEGSILLTDLPGSPINRVLTAGGSGGIEVPVLTGRTFCREHGVVPEVLKIDVEGFEQVVLRGFDQVLTDTKLILVETESQVEVRRVLCAQLGFLGPYKVDYRNRVLRSDRIHDEDWLFVHPRAMGILQDMLFQIEA
jgi:FkbM family methyltransferase